MAENLPPPPGSSAEQHAQANHQHRQNPGSEPRNFSAQPAAAGRQGGIARYIGSSWGRGFASLPSMSRAKALMPTAMPRIRVVASQR